MDNKQFFAQLITKSLNLNPWTSINRYTQYSRGCTHISLKELSQLLHTKSTHLTIRNRLPGVCPWSNAVFIIYKQYNSPYPYFNAYDLTDDTVIYTLRSTLTCLQSAFHTFPSSLISHKLVLNTEKTKCMIFSTSTSHSDYSTTFIETVISLTMSYKYLGIWLDNKLILNFHILQLCQNVNIKLGVLHRIKHCLSTWHY